MGKEPPALRSEYLEYKVVETSTVHDQALEEIINEWVPRGWDFDGFHFVTNVSSRRPVLAFVLLTRPRARQDPGGKEQSVPDDAQEHDGRETPSLSRDGTHAAP